MPKRDILDQVRASAIDVVVVQEGNFYIKGEAGTGKSVVLSDCRGCGWFVVRAGWEDCCPAGGELQVALGR